MRIGFHLGSLVLVVLVASATAEAGDGGIADAIRAARHLFDASDADRDGALSPQEYIDAGLARYGLAFEAFDSNRDGKVSREEYLDVFRKHHPPTDARAI